MISLQPPIPGFATPQYALEPQLSDINMGPYGSVAPANLYNGYFGESPVPASSLYSEVEVPELGRTVLTLSNPGGLRVGNPMLCTASTKLTAGNLPLIPMSSKFAVKVRARVLPPQPGNWFCVGWWLPIEHDLKGSATMPGTVPAGTAPSGANDTFLEGDGHEGGGGTGLGEGTGMWGASVIHRPAVAPTVIANGYNDLLFNPGRWHDYVHTWDPVGLRTFWIDGVQLWSSNLLSGAGAFSPAELAWIRGQHAYTICDADSSPPGLEYQLQLARWECWTP